MTAPQKSHLELAVRLAARLRAARADIVSRWLDRIVARVSITPQQVFPTDELLNHVPILVDGIADYLERIDNTTEGDVPLQAKARELGALRYAQGFDAYEILKEHELLAGVLHSFLREALPHEGRADGGDVAYVWHRIAEVTEQLRQATVMHFLRISTEQVRVREERLRRFNRMVSHELKNRVGAIRGASALLEEPWLAPEQREKFLRIIAQNAESLQHVIENLVQLTHVDADSRQRRNILLPQAAAEVVRQLRDAATLAGVQVRLDPNLPAVEVDAAAVELCLANYVSNAIKYSNPATDDRRVEISGEIIVATSSAPGELIVHVRDNGVGVPLEARPRLFEQFYRAPRDTITGVEGTGLGLSIVQETIISLGGRVKAEFPDEGGSIFSFSLPSRRDEDAAAAGTRREGATAG